MGHRLTRIYTRTGDEGTTGLADGTRLRKDAVRIELLGDLDELNSHLGMLLTYALPSELADCFTELQHLLFDLGGDLSIPGRTSISASHVDWLENWLDHYNDTLPPLKEFILPGGNAAAAQGHLARSVCRRAERRAVALSQREDPGLNTLAFLNRLSDFLFVACRILARMNSKNEVFWQLTRTPPLVPPD